MFRGNRILFVYSLTMTCAVVVQLLHANSGTQRTTFDEITVRRINVVEPDGTLRMVISNHASLPGIIVAGKEQPFPRPQAGMLFYNDEGSENGGLIFGGHKDTSGKIVNSGGSLSFDKYGAKQIVQVAGVDDAEDRFAGLAVSDSPKAGESHSRVWIGRDESGAASVILKDAQGRPRVVMQVLEDGTAKLATMDEHGKVEDQIFPVRR
jgi:hypothetical protein